MTLLFDQSLLFGSRSFPGTGKSENFERLSLLATVSSVWETQLRNRKVFALPVVDGKGEHAYIADESGLFYKVLLSTGEVLDVASTDDLRPISSLALNSDDSLVIATVANHVYVYNVDQMLLKQQALNISNAGRMSIGIVTIDGGFIVLADSGLLYLESHACPSPAPTLQPTNHPTASPTTGTPTRSPTQRGHTTDVGKILLADNFISTNKARSPPGVKF